MHFQLGSTINYFQSSIPHILYMLKYITHVEKKVHTYCKYHYFINNFMYNVSIRVSDQLNVIFSHLK